MNSVRSRANPVFRQRDSVDLAEGTNQGTFDMFIGLRPEVNWAEMRERNGGEA